MNVLKIFKPVAKAVAKTTASLVTKFKANEPEIMVVGGALGVVVATGLAIKGTLKVQKTMDNARDKMVAAEAQHDGTVMDPNGNQIAPISDSEFRKLVAKVRSETIWEFIKLYGWSALIMVLSLFTLVKGHWILKERYILTATSLKGMEEFVRFLKKNVVEDAGEEKWKEYSQGKVLEEKFETEVKRDDGAVVKKTINVPICKPHENPWQFEYCEEMFDSWQPNVETNLQFLQGVEDFFDKHKYQTDKKAEISMYEILDYMGFKWDKVDKHYRKWLRTNGWAHDVNGDGFISMGLWMPINQPARRRLSDKVFFEFNAEGFLDELVNKYTLE